MAITCHLSEADRKHRFPNVALTVTATISFSTSDSEYNSSPHMPIVTGSRVDSYEIVATPRVGGMGEVSRSDATMKTRRRDQGTSRVLVRAILSVSAALSRKRRPLPPYLLADFVSVVASSGFFHNSP